MKNKILKFSVAVPVILSLFFAGDVYASAGIGAWGLTNWGGQPGYTVTTGSLATSSSVYFFCNDGSGLIPQFVDTVSQPLNGYSLTTTTIANQYVFNVPSNDTYYQNTFSFAVITGGGAHIFNCNNSNNLVLNYLQYGPVNPFSTSTQPDFYHFPTTTLDATSTYFFVDCSAYDNVPLFSSGTIAGIGCQAQKVGMNIIGFLVTPPTWVSTYLNNGVSSIKNAFPFNMVFGVVNSITDNTSSTSVNYSDLTFTFPSSTVMSSISVTPISATFLKDILTNPKCDSTCAENKKNDIFQFISAMVFVALGIKLITLII